MSIYVFALDRWFSIFLSLNTCLNYQEVYRPMAKAAGEKLQKINCKSIYLFIICLKIYITLLKPFFLSLRNSFKSMTNLQKLAILVLNYQSTIILPVNYLKNYTVFSIPYFYQLII